MSWANWLGKNYVENTTKKNHWTYCTHLAIFVKFVGDLCIIDQHKTKKLKNKQRKKVRHTNKQVTTQINKRTNRETHIVFVLTTLPAMYKLLMHKYHRSSKNKETKEQTKGKKVRHTNKQVTTQINKRTNKETTLFWF